MKDNSAKDAVLGLIAVVVIVVFVLASIGVWTTESIGPSGKWWAEAFVLAICGVVLAGVIYESGE